jgi:hypothetical protein
MQNLMLRFKSVKKMQKRLPTKKSKTPFSVIFSLITFLAWVSLKLFQRIRNQHHILRFFVPILHFCINHNHQPSTAWENQVVKIVVPYPTLSQSTIGHTGLFPLSYSIFSVWGSERLYPYEQEVGCGTGRAVSNDRTKVWSSFLTPCPYLPSLAELQT